MDDSWTRLALAFRRPRPIRGLDESATLQLVMPLAFGIWSAGIGAFALALGQEGLLSLGRMAIYLTLGPFLVLAVLVCRRTGLLPGFLAVSVICWLASLSVTTPFYYFAGGIIGTALTACLASWFGAWRGTLYAIITIVGQLCGGVLFGDPLVVDRLILIILSMVFVVVIAGGVADRTDSAIAERDALLAEFSYLSNHDVLTGLANRRAFERVVEERLSTSGHDFSLALFDVDRFKDINDTAGHREGDLVLCAVAERLVGSFPEAFVARLGGDEFVLVVDGDLMEHELVDRSLHAFALPMVIDGDRLRTVSLSVGTARRAPHLDTASSLLTLADERLYSMKRGIHAGGRRASA
ncbi:MAG: diguanylate cyclase [Actinomycetota bacterium]